MCVIDNYIGFDTLKVSFYYREAQYFPVLFRSLKTTSMQIPGRQLNGWENCERFS